jgi:hypothetical protein
VPLDVEVGRGGTLPRGEGTYDEGERDDGGEKECESKDARGSHQDLLVEN